MADARVPDEPPTGESNERRIVDAAGVHWSVNLVVVRESWAPRRACLIFASASVVRRVWEYPADWALLEAPELMELSWRA